MEMMDFHNLQTKALDLEKDGDFRLEKCPKCESAAVHVETGYVKGRGIEDVWTLLLESKDNRLVFTRCWREGVCRDCGFRYDYQQYPGVGMSWQPKNPAKTGVLATLKAILA